MWYICMLITRTFKTRKSMLIRGNAAACAFTYWRDVFGTLANSAFTGIPDYYAHETW